MYRVKEKAVYVCDSLHQSVVNTVTTEYIGICRYVLENLFNICCRYIDSRIELLT